MFETLLHAAGVLTPLVLAALLARATRLLLLSDLILRPHRAGKEAPSAPILRSRHRRSVDRAAALLNRISQESPTKAPTGLENK